MIKFSLDSENIKRLITLSNMSKEISGIAKPIYVIDNNSMTFTFLGDSSAMTFTVDVQNLEIDASNEQNYFSMEINELCSLILKVSSDKFESTKVEIDFEQKKINFNCEGTNTSITRAIDVNQVTEEEAKDSLTTIDNTVSSNFGEKDYNITITPDLISFIDTAEKFRKVSGTSTNTVAICHNKVKYADSTVIIESTLKSDVSPVDDEVYVDKKITDILKPFVKNSPVTVKFNDTFSVAYVNSVEFGFKAVFSLTTPSFDYPSKEDIEGITPSADNSIVVSVKKDEILRRFSLFNGIFQSSNWEWKAIDFDASDEYLKNNNLRFVHTDSTAGVDTLVDISIVSRTDTSNVIKFPLSLNYLEDIVSLIKEDDIQIEFNSSADVPGIVIKSANTTAICVKFMY